MSYKTLILKDEPHHRERLLELLQHHPAYTVAGVAATLDEGRKMIELHQPDICFMDVVLPPYTSFDLLRQLPAIPFGIIFTTSYEAYAVKAFRLSAIDYLLKPIDDGELAAALQKFEARQHVQQPLQLRNLLHNLGVGKPADNKVALPTLTGYIFVTVKDIVRCESDNTYTTFHTHDRRKIVVSRTLKDCEQMLTEYRFCRVHNSHLINLEYIVEYMKGEGGQVRMSDGSVVDVSRRRKDEFLRQSRSAGTGF